MPAPIAQRILCLCVFVLACEAPELRAETPFKVGEVRKSVVCIQRLVPGLSPAVGSGFLVSKDGLIYTNRHVVQPADGMHKGTRLIVGVPSAKDADELEYFRAVVVYCPPDKDNLDFAILKIAATPEYGPFPALGLAEAKPELGSNVAVIGYPHVKYSQPVLSFNKGSISATKVEFDGANYYQTDATVNSGNSGGPLVNEEGRVLGIVTFKRVKAVNMAYALPIKQVQEVGKVDAEALAKIKPELGPLDPKKVPRPQTISPKAENWEVRKGESKEGRDVLTIDRDGGTYWLSSKEVLPEDFQLVIRCQILYLTGRQGIRASQRDFLRQLAVRFNNDELDKDINERVGNLIQYSHAHLILWKEGTVAKVEEKGNPEGPFTLTITKQGGDLTISVDDAVLLTHHDDKPLQGKHKFAIGGYLSQLHLGEVSVWDLTEPAAGAKP